jgi:hypothetical protein
MATVFLGDVQRVRLKSSGSTPASTPPSSPPPTLSISRPDPPTNLATVLPSISQEHRLGPNQSLELRVRWLEALIYGAKHESLAGLHERKAELKRGETLLRAAEHTHRRMNDVASTHDALRKFVNQCELTPLALPQTLNKLRAHRRPTRSVSHTHVCAFWHAPEHRSPRVCGHVSRRVGRRSIGTRARYSRCGQRHA